MELLTYDDAGPFDSPLLPHTLSRFLDILHRQVSLIFYVALGSYCTESNIVTTHL